jgi:hypothetical protein
MEPMVPYPMCRIQSNVPEPIGFRLRTHPHVDWFLRFVGKLFKIKKQKTVCAIALFRFDFGPVSLLT